MGQEFFIKDNNLEQKVRELLPSQGGLGAGVDLSASTTIIPIVDLTESAEGSTLRSDLQRSLSLTTATAHNVANTTDTIVNNTGYFRIVGNFNTTTSTSATINGTFALTDGVTTKTIVNFRIAQNADTQNIVVPYDFSVFLGAGESLTGTTNSSTSRLSGASRQIATIDGVLVNP